MIEDYDQRLLRLRRFANQLADLEARLPGAVREVLWIIEEVEEERRRAVRTLAGAWRQDDEEAQ